jgi:hypothetical protein
MSKKIKKQQGNDLLMKTCGTEFSPPDNANRGCEEKMMYRFTRAFSNAVAISLIDTEVCPGYFSYGYANRF